MIRRAVCWAFGHEPTGWIPGRDEARCRCGAVVMHGYVLAKRGRRRWRRLVRRVLGGPPVPDHVAAWGRARAHYGPERVRRAMLTTGIREGELLTPELVAAVRAVLERRYGVRRARGRARG